MARPLDHPAAALLAGVVLAAALLAATAMSERTAVSQPTASHAASNSGTRTIYPRDRLPALQLADGTREPIRSILNPTGALRYGSFVWNEQGVPGGRVWVYVDLTRQLVSVFRGGHEIGSAVILYGAPEKPSPIGSFAVIQKAADYHSRTYDAPMPYMLRLTSDGVAIHASSVRSGAATHGCIGVPIDFARKLFDTMKVGDRVTIVQSPPAKAASSPSRLPSGSTTS